MECPFCAETIKDEALVCKVCSRDLRVVRPVIDEVQEIVAEMDRLRRDIGRISARLERIKRPARYFVAHAIGYVLVPILLLVLAHVLVTIVFDAKPIYLRLASVVIPIPFGLVLYTREKVGIGGAVLVGAVTAILAVISMLAITGFNDNVPIVPGPWIEWRETIEYAASIMLAFVTGNIIGFLIFDVLPKTMAQGGKPNAFAFSIARLLGQHVGEEQLRRRARLIQDLLVTVGPLVGVAVTAAGSVYAGLKGVIGW